MPANICIEPIFDFCWNHGRGSLTTYPQSFEMIHFNLTYSWKGTWINLLTDNKSKKESFHGIKIFWSEHGSARLNKHLSLMVTVQVKLNLSEQFIGVRPPYVGITPDEVLWHRHPSSRTYPWCHNAPTRAGANWRLVADGAVPLLASQGGGYYRISVSAFPSCHGRADNCDALGQTNRRGDRKAGKNFWRKCIRMNLARQKIFWSSWMHKPKWAV